MKKLVPALILLAMIGAPAVAGAADSFSDIARQEREFRLSILKSEVKIYRAEKIREGAITTAYGSGIIVFKEEKADKVIFDIVTAAHVLSENAELFEVVKLGVAFQTKKLIAVANPKIYGAKFMFGAWGYEYVALRIEVPKNEAADLDVSVAKVAPDLPKFLETYWASGYLGGYYPVVNKAYLSRINVQARDYADSSPYWLLMSIDFIADGSNGGGMSGGGVFNVSGEWVGLIWATENSGQIVSATPALFIYNDYLEKKKAKAEKEPAELKPGN